MSDDVATVGTRLAAVRRRIADAEQAAHRTPGEVTLLLATKTVPVGVVRQAVTADVRARATTPGNPVVLGENRVQELVAKAPLLREPDDGEPPPPPALHLIGPLQSNKVNHALRWADCIQSVASIDLARRLSDRCAAADRVLDVMVQVNVSAEPTKSGVPPVDAADLATEIGGLPGLRLTGFMTIGAHSPDADLVRAGFARLRAVRDAVLGSGLPGTTDARDLSMGMSGDLELAVAEGATMVRVGSAVFGSRPRR